MSRHSPHWAINCPSQWISQNPSHSHRVTGTPSSVNIRTLGDGVCSFAWVQLLFLISHFWIPWPTKVFLKQLLRLIVGGPSSEFRAPQHYRAINHSLLEMTSHKASLPLALRVGFAVTISVDPFPAVTRAWSTLVNIPSVASFALICLLANTCSNRLILKPSVLSL